MKRSHFLLLLLVFWIVLFMIIFGVVFYSSSKGDTFKTSDATESTTTQPSSDDNPDLETEDNPHSSDSASDSCPFPEAESWISDGICDDKTNIESCNFDGGDCCSEDSIMAFCDECICYQGTTTTTSTTSMPPWLWTTAGPLPDCPNHLAPYLGDGYCDDQANNFKCNHDQQDCCIGTDHSQMYCIACDCIRLNTEGCDRNKLQLLKNGFCEDESNTFECAWDGGDCCDPQAYFYKCDDCLCYQNGGLNLSLSASPSVPFCERFFWKGDGVCDDSNNFDTCDFDSGDCCQVGSHQLCDQCECYGMYFFTLFLFFTIFHYTILGALTTCPNPSWVADGYCDDRNNGAHCDYDGGDCCFKQEINDTFCQKCLCHEGRQHF